MVDLSELKALDKDYFKYISSDKPRQQETAITMQILTKICHNLSNNTSSIIFDDSYKETGNTTKNPKSGTAADFVLALKDKSGQTGLYAFQAKIGRKYTNKQTQVQIGNRYDQIDETAGKNGPRQIDKYNQFKQKNKNLPITCNYLFYNGNYTGVSNQNDIIQLNSKSFWITDISDVIAAMNIHNKISLSDVITMNSHANFIEFLNGVVN